MLIEGLEFSNLWLIHQGHLSTFNMDLKYNYDKFIKLDLICINECMHNANCGMAETF